MNTFNQKATKFILCPKKKPKIDNKFRLEFVNSGASVCLVLVTPTQIYCANAGDSKAVLRQGEKGNVDLNSFHKPDIADEKARILNANHQVENSRVDGFLAISRGIGFLDHKNDAKLKPKK